MNDFLFRGNLAELDPDVYELTQLEAERQYRKLIMIPSESTAPLAVREAMASAFQNLYAEGYPDEDTRFMTQDEIMDYPSRLAHYRRYSDPRYYKGVEYADLVEALARRRCAEAFAANGYKPDDLFVNVQPLSGAPANNAVYTALISPGDTILGMNLLHGGHLSHGSSVNRSGKFYNAMHYTIDPVTEQIDYEGVQKLATETKPKIIIAGYSSYPWVPDWARFRAIADSVGATLLADISHIAGLISAGVIPSPVGHAHVITFTTHKTLCGPRAACIITTDLSLSKKIDKAVFPGEQGGPHVHVMAALALTFKLARTEQFKKLQKQIVENCETLTSRLKERGFKIPFNGTNTHLTNIDCKTVKGPDGSTLSGDQAARILDIVGIVCNRNTIPGDKTSALASGVRLGTPWLTQRGLGKKEVSQVADIIADVLLNCVPYSVETRQGLVQRAKIDFKVLEDARIRVRNLAESAGIDFEASRHSYPHFYYLDDKCADSEWMTLNLKGDRVEHFLNSVVTSDVEALTDGNSQPTRVSTPDMEVDGLLERISEDKYKLTIPGVSTAHVAAWLRDLSDGFVGFDDDPRRRLPGPIVVECEKSHPVKIAGEPVSAHKAYFISKKPQKDSGLPVFQWNEGEASLKRTPLFETHRKLGAKIIPFAGWEMPVWYTSVVEEHLASRQAAGLFDVSHMGVYQAEGLYASAFLDSVCGNDIGSLAIGESCYTQFLDPDANVIDDTLIYRRAEEKYLVVVNASNDDKDRTWLLAVRDGKVKIDNDDPAALAFGRKVIFRNLRDPKEGADRRIDIALQGPKSRDILLSLGCDAPTRKRIMALKRTELCDAVVGGFDLIVSRTGYTGEKMAFELFAHPDIAEKLWSELMKAGESVGLKCCGLGARDSLRTEAGLPLYGHEMGGDDNFGVGDAGFGSYVKTYKPWFIGRKAYIEQEAKRKGVVARFRFTEKGVRMAHNGDPVLDKKGRVIGKVTSCAVDSEGYLTGQAYVELKSAVEGTPIAIYQGAPDSIEKSPKQLATGDKVTLPTPAVIVSRFPKL